MITPAGFCKVHILEDVHSSMLTGRHRFVSHTFNGHAGFKYPVTLSGLGQAFSALAAFVTCRVLKLVPAEKRVDAKFFAAKMLPVGFFNATTLMFGNAVYMYLTVAFIQMLKAFTPVITMVGLFLASMEVRCMHSPLRCAVVSAEV